MGQIIQFDKTWSNENTILSDTIESSSDLHTYFISNIVHINCNQLTIDYPSEKPICTWPEYS